MGDELKMKYAEFQFVQLWDGRMGTISKVLSSGYIIEDNFWSWLEMKNEEDPENYIFPHVDVDKTFSVLEEEIEGEAQMAEEVFEFRYKMMESVLGD
jgi:hypothetical protein